MFFFHFSKSGSGDNINVGEFNLEIFGILFKEILYLLDIQVYYSLILGNG